MSVQLNAAPVRHRPSLTVNTANPPSTRQVFDTSEDARLATFDVARTARRSIHLFTHDLEPNLYDRIEFLDLVKNLILTQKFARVRILIKSPMRCVQEGHRLVELARQFSTFVEIRVAHRDDHGRRDTFLIADQKAVVCRARAERYEGIADTRSPAVAVHYLEFFDTAWARAEGSSELKRLFI